MNRSLHPSTLILTGSALALALALTGCGKEQVEEAPKVTASAACLAAGDDCKRFTLLHTNDHHGRFWHSKRGEYGMAARKTVIDGIRKEVAEQGGEVLLLSGGDINTGVPESDLQDAEPDFIGMNHLGYDAMAVGNHEFDNPTTIVDKQRDWSNFPWLAANIYRQVDGEWQLYFEPYKLFDVQGLKLAVVGLTTEQTADIGNPEYVQGLKFTSPQQEMKGVLTELEQKHHPDLVFGLTHMGHYENGNHGSNTPGDVALARSLEPGQVEAIIGGHSQLPVCMEGDTGEYVEDYGRDEPCKPDRQNGTWIMQAYEWGKYVGRADFEYYGGELHLANYQLVPVNTATKFGSMYPFQMLTTRDPETLELLRPYQNKGQQKLKEKIGVAEEDFIGKRKVVRYQATPLGIMIAHAQTQLPVPADFGIMNSGGIRTTIEKGPIRYRDVLKVQPFANSVTVTEMKGDELKKYLSKVAIKTRGSGGFAHFSGIKMTVDCVARDVDITSVGGKPFSLSDTYRFTLPSYNAAGGNKYPKLEQARNTGFVDADMLYQFIKEHKSLNPMDYDKAKDVRYINSRSPYGCGG
ncbi:MULTISPECIES: bifunctional UDP-sugar hydrolase/5'-nucleotidase UshA [Ferrimonas]|uniref:bifunctional UDP-sugar hydrolase/5'-nucleotidase UshA n=1 Tax=Ferrimonas TaxID=44011 RepID=UPI000416C61A|nr:MULTISPECIES: bifunctional UDP-sugar hydrolase/5'-nucleotidase UshA [Ferrimonas]USD39064.1 bifunctional UDP-sugar hydrolase/5'-nucleotidase [Ferrimonas sp. SCSIO 43195]